MKATITSLLFALITLTTGLAGADEWECTAGGSNSSGAEAVCYVSYVRFYPGKSTYVKAKLHDPDNVTSCNYVRVQIDTGNSGAQGIDEVRGAEAVLLTALTTGMPVKFWRLTSHGTSSDCTAGTVIISKPGN